MDGLSPEETGLDGASPVASGPRARQRTLHYTYRPKDEEESAPSAVPEPRQPEAGTASRLGLKVPLAVLGLYALIIVAATFPRINMARDTLPGYRIDPLQHLWVMNWYKSCLAEGRPHVFCPELQYPTGAPLSNFSPMLFQSLLFLPISSVVGNDILTYNILWFVGFIFSGFSVFVLAWTVLRDRWGAAFAGVVGMLCTPMMLRGHGHLELIYAGSICLFLAAWIGWVDRPGRRGLLASAGLYLLSSLCAAYFAVFAVVPAVIFVAWRLVSHGKTGAWPWLRARIGWFAAFLALVVPGLLATFSAQVWAVGQGMTMHRSLSEYEKYGSPIWSYVLPTTHHALFSVFPVNGFDPLGYPEIECASYLGVVTLLLMGYSASRRVKFAGSRFWWSTFAILAMLSLGAYWRVGTHKIPLPGLWLRQYVPIFQTIRAPSRFNLLVCGVAAVLAGSGMVRLLSKFRLPVTRGVVFLAAVGLLTADLRMVPFAADMVRPKMPASYAWIRGQNPDAALLETPVLSSGCNHPITTTCGHWQSTHRLKTSAGYSGFVNAEFDDLMVDDSPLSAISLLDPTSLDKPNSLNVGIVANTSLLDYTWMVVNRSKFDYILLHRWDPTINGLTPSVARLASLIHHAIVFDEPDVLVYDAKKLERPKRPTLFLEKGWRAWRDRGGPPKRVVGKKAQIAAFLPEGAGPQVLALEARAFRNARKVVVREGDKTLATWEIGTGPIEGFATPPLDLAPGMHTLTVESDGDDRPKHPEDEPATWDASPYSLIVRKLEIRAANP